MHQTTQQRTVNDDAKAALRRAIGFAGLFGLAGVAAIACTARAPQPTGPATDRLLAQEALWQAEATSAPAIAFPPALLARRSDPAVAAELSSAQRRLAADRAAAAARRDAVLRRMDDARADRDLNESQRSVLSLKIDQAFEQRQQAQQRGDMAAVAAADKQVAMLKAQVAKAIGGSTNASRTLNALNDRMMALATAEHGRATRNLSAVRDQLNGG